MRLLAVVLCTVSFAACSKSQPLPGFSDTTQSVQPQTTADAVNRVAGDRELLRQALILADHKGTLESALTEAAQDSRVGIKMREALVLGYEAKTEAEPPPGPRPARPPVPGPRPPARGHLPAAIRFPASMTC